jgi:hypothetical protein
MLRRRRRGRGQRDTEVEEESPFFGKIDQSKHIEPKRSLSLVYGFYLIANPLARTAQ